MYVYWRLNNLFKFNVTLLKDCQRLRSLPQANTFYIVYILCTTRFTWSGGGNSNNINMTVPTSGAGSAFLTEYLRVHRQNLVGSGCSIFDFLWCFALSILICAFYLRTLIILLMSLSFSNTMLLVFRLNRNLQKII